ncbi:MAG: ATP-binding protein [Cyanobacteria bacterium J06621_3]
MTIPSVSFPKSLLKPDIRLRLALGSVLAIAIATIGIQLGQKISDKRVKQPAQRQLEAAYQQTGQLSELQKKMLSTKGMLLAYIKRPELLIIYGYQLTNRAEQLQYLLDQLAADAGNVELGLPASDGAIAQLSSQQTQQQEIDRWLTTCQDVGIRYEQALTRLLAQPDPARAEALSNSYLQTQLIDFMGSDAVSQLESCSLSLEELAARNQDIVLQASYSLEDATQLQSRITYLSLLGSLLAAVALALYNSWLIARPLKAVSQVAQRVSDESNFDLQAPVYTQDEVGVVAESLNKLIRTVRHLLAEQQVAQNRLEQYNQTLESTVQLRTREIYQQKEQLEETVKDLHEAQSQLIQAEKMSGLGQLVAGIAHEINNPVNFIHGNLKHAEAYFQDLTEAIALYAQHTTPNETLQTELDDIDIEFIVEDTTKLLQSMRIGTERIREIVLSLRNFSRLDESDRKTADLHEGIDSTLLILNHRLAATPKRPTISIVNYYAELPPIECFPSQLNQVFMNIIANAIDAFESQPNSVDSRQLASSVPEKKCFNPQITISTRQVDDNRVQIAIADNGSGIPEAVQQRIFEPFFTTKDVGKGTGMGLSISYKIITERHQGSLICESVVGKGTTFLIELPIRANRTA